MLFNSFPFLMLFPVAALLYGWLRHKGWRTASQVTLLAMSLCFYCWGGFYSLPFLCCSIVFNWAISKRIGAREDPKPVRKRWLVAALVVNVAYLASFKYINLFLSAIAPIFHAHLTVPDWRFPLGISFFTLTQVMYLVDCFENLVLPSTLFDHATFASFFPYVTAGPLARARPMLDQIRNNVGTIPADLVSRGLVIFTMGLFKKAAIADSLATIANPLFTGGDVTRFDTLCGILAYTFQIYFDFSGYSEMALGVAKMLGFEIPINFDAPFRARSEIEFWQRWHISLSSFITTYLFTPIVRSIKGRITLGKAAVATILAMTISGLWHGPAWTYVVWGLLHGVALAINQVWRKKLKINITAAGGWVCTFTFINVANVFFRAPTVGIALRLIHNVFFVSSDSQLLLPLTADKVLYIAPSLLAIPCGLLGPSAIELMHAFKPRTATIFAYASIAIMAVIFLNSVAAQAFIYIGF